MKRNFNANIIGESEAGSTGYPGNSYEAIWIYVALYDDGVFESRAKYGRGSNQGYLEQHFGLNTRARGHSLDEALEAISSDVLEWECKNISVAERRSAIRECKINAEDWLEANWSKDEQIARLEALLSKAKQASD